MGNFLLNVMELLSGKQSKRIIMVGLDAAGKTTILYKLNLGETVTTIPTIGFNVETVRYKKVEFTCWDIGGQKKIRGLWRHYFHDTDAVIFVLDSNDPDRMEEAKEELMHVMNHDLLRDAVLLVIANKQDLPHSMTPAEIMQRLQLAETFRSRPWHIQGAVATTGAGLYEALDWLSETLTKRPKRQSSANSSFYS